MDDVLKDAPFYSDIKINPAFGSQRYPFPSSVPDTALPNYIGNFFYKKTFSYEKSEGKYSIYFEGVQNNVSVWLNNVYLGTHEGYSTPFQFDIPDEVLKDGDNTIIFSVSNFILEGHDGQYLIGLTTRAVNEYTGGIIGKVEIRTYNSSMRDLYVLISEDLKTAKVKIDDLENNEYKWEVK